MTFSESIKSVYSNYANFRGKAPRSEYWFFVLFCFLINIAVGILSILFPSTLVKIITIAHGLFTLFTFVPSLAVAVRRLHDVGKSGWWLLIALIPLVGVFILIYFMVLPGQTNVTQTTGDNPETQNQNPQI